jgi:hypothetical protein
MLLSAKQDGFKKNTAFVQTVCLNGTKQNDYYV